MRNVSNLCPTNASALAPRTIGKRIRNVLATYSLLFPLLSHLRVQNLQSHSAHSKTSNMHRIVVLLLAAILPFVAANPLGTKTILEPIKPTPLDTTTTGHVSAITPSISSRWKDITSGTFVSVTAEAAGGQDPIDQASANLAAAIAAPSGSYDTIVTLSPSSEPVVTTDSLPTAITRPISQLSATP